MKKILPLLLGPELIWVSLFALSLVAMVLSERMGHVRPWYFNWSAWIVPTAGTIGCFVWLWVVSPGWPWLHWMRVAVVSGIAAFCLASIWIEADPKTPVDAGGIAYWAYLILGHFGIILLLSLVWMLSWVITFFRHRA